MGKKQPQIIGHWRITSMTEWDFVDAEVPGYFEFVKDYLGDFQFGHVCGDLDWWEAQCLDGQPKVEFRFEGTDGIDECVGRGWAVIEGGTLVGMIYFALGDESGFTAKREKEP